MSEIIQQKEVKITIAKLIQIAYSKDKGLTTKIMKSIGPITLTVDLDGNAKLSAKVGVVTFNGAPVLEQIGFKVKMISASFSNQGGMKVGYKVTISLKITSATFSGDFDLEELITSCSGLLCIAARALKDKNKNPAYDLELLKIMDK